MTYVVNGRLEEYDFSICRPTIFGNPFIIGRDGDRQIVIQKFRAYFYDRITSDEVFKNRVLELKGSRLACVCKPLECHGDVIAEYLNNL